MDRKQIAKELWNDDPEIIEWVEEFYAEPLSKKTDVELEVAVLSYEDDEDDCFYGNEPETQVYLTITSVEQVIAVLNLADQWGKRVEEWSERPGYEYSIWHEGSIQILVEDTAVGDLVEEIGETAKKEGAYYRTVG